LVGPVTCKRNVDTLITHEAQLLLRGRVHI
jgi:hypothetical protein